MPCLFHPQKHLFFRQSFIVATWYIDDASISSQTCVASALSTSRTISASRLLLARPIAIGTPAGKVLVKRSRTIEHVILLSMGIKAKVEKGGESRMIYNSCCLKENTKPCGHLVWYFVVVMQKRLFSLLTKEVALDVSQLESGWLNAATFWNMPPYYHWESKQK